MEPNFLLGIFIFIIGAMTGSFLNVCIVRLPLEKSVVFPGSHCVACRAPIQWYDNIPLISWFVLGGRCRACKEKISFRYWFVELLTGLTFLFLYRHYGIQPILWPYLVMVSGFIVAIFVDFKHRIIPDEVSIGGMIAGVAFSLFVEIIEGVSIASFINKTEKLPWINFSIRKLDTLKILLMVLWETKSLDDKKYIYLSTKLDEIGKMLGGWNGQIQKQNSPAIKTGEK